MRGDWLEDVVALLDSGSIHKAAERRCVTQPAFSRRIMAIEEQLGLSLLDRSKRPAEIAPLLREREPRLRELLAAERELIADLKHQHRQRRKQITIATPHAIASAQAPELIKALTARIDVNVRLKSDNHDGCRALLMTRQCDLVILYRSGSGAAAGEDGLLEEVRLGADWLVPVIASESRDEVCQAYDQGIARLIAYPTSAFLGEVMAREIHPRLAPGIVLERRTETELTLAALHLALGGVAIAWVPLSLAAASLAEGRLSLLADRLPRSELSIVLQRLAGAHAPIEDAVWQAIRDFAWR